MAGHSGTPLAKKLGIVDGTSVGLIAGPDGFLAQLDPLPKDVSFTDDTADVVILFATGPDELMERFSHAMERIPADGSIWVAWPKKSSSIPGELVENDLRDLLLPTGLVDNKVCAIDDDWSGLRFVVRKERRPNWPMPR